MYSDTSSSSEEEFDCEGYLRETQYLSDPNHPDHYSKHPLYEERKAQFLKSLHSNKVNDGGKKDFEPSPETESTKKEGEKAVPSKTSRVLRSRASVDAAQSSPAIDSGFIDENEITDEEELDSDQDDGDWDKTKEAKQEMVSESATSSSDEETQIQAPAPAIAFQAPSTKKGTRVTTRKHLKSRYH